MKDHRFTELLNLYIDRQISEAETAELEAEMQQSPARQSTYRQYCQIHSATKLVYASFRVNGSEQPVLPADRAGVVELFETQRRKNHFAYYASGLAAAACLALVFVRWHAPSGAGDLAVIAQTETGPSAVDPAPVEVAALPPSQTFEPEVGLVSLRNSDGTTPDYSAMLAALREQDEERALANGELQTVRAQSLFDDGLFKTNRPAPAQDPRLFRIQPASAQQIESTAFQFQR